MPPAIAAKTICKDTDTPETTSGLTYWMYCVSSAPPTAVNPALITVTRSFSRITLTPLDAAAISSSEIASSAMRPIPTSIQRQTARPISHSTKASR